MSKRRSKIMDARQLCGKHVGRWISIPTHRGQDPLDPQGRLVWGTIRSIYHGPDGDTGVVLEEHRGYTHGLNPYWVVAVGPRPARIDLRSVPSLPAVLAAARRGGPVRPPKGP
jgi:hypothetical protein